MAILDINALQSVLKQKYTQRRFNLLCYKKNPFYALCPKITDFGGKNKVVALRNAVPQGRGTSIAAAQAGKTASVYTGFVVTRVSDYTTASIAGESIKAAKGDENTLIEGLTKEIDGAIHVTMRSLAISMYRNGGGSRGQIANVTSVTSGTNTITTGIATTVIQLVNLTDITNFEVNMQPMFANDDGSSATPLGTLAIPGAQPIVTSVDRDLGLVYINGTYSALVTGVAQSGINSNGSYIFQGNTTGSDYGKMIKGLAAWVPTTAPIATDNFLSVNRFQDVTRLAGIRYSGGGGPIEESLIETATRACREGSSPDYAFLNPLDWSNLVKALGAKVLYERSAPLDEPDIGFKAVQLSGPEGYINVVADINTPKGLCYLLQMDTWHLESLGEAPMILDFDGNTILRSATSDDYEVRIGYYANLTCEAPGWNSVISL
jgi:hypothetical protein